MNINFNRVDYSDEIMSKITTILTKTLKNKALWNYLYTINKKWIDSDINVDPYFDGKTIKSGNDLMNSIEDIRDVYVSQNINGDSYCIFVTGEYWLDEEHGFAISFPNGEFVKAANGKTRNSNWEFIATGIGQMSDAF